jgi:uncharacterized C2H2 Zn-finger protein
MPSWVLNCPNCDRLFKYAEIVEDRLRRYYLPWKPEFPVTGIELRCPECRRTATYQRDSLLYRAHPLISKHQ